MMGQQQQTVTKAGGALRRAVVLMTVVALMAMMLAMSVAGPAFAAKPAPHSNPGAEHCKDQKCPSYIPPVVVKLP